MIASDYESFRRANPERTAIFNGVSWRWFEAGTGRNAVVLLPGAVGGADIFFIVFQRFAPHTRVLAVDIPYAADAASTFDGLDALLDSRDIEGVILLGASFSGIFVQVFARRFPARTRALILSHTGALDRSRAARERRSAAIASRIPLPLVRGVLKLVVRLLLRKASHAAMWRRLYFDALNRLTREDLISRYLLGASLEELETGTWTGPVLIVHSDDDVVAKPAERERLRLAYPGAAWHQFTGAGHSSYSMDPEAYADVLFRWTATVLPEGAVR
jgi:maspardin